MLLIRIPHTTPIVRLLAPLGLGGGLYDPPFHLYDFSPAVLRKCSAGQASWTSRRIRGGPLSPASGSRLAAAFFGALAIWLYAATRGAVSASGREQDHVGAEAVTVMLDSILRWLARTIDANPRRIAIACLGATGLAIALVARIQSPRTSSTSCRRSRPSAPHRRPR